MGRLPDEAARRSAGGAAAWPLVSCMFERGLCTCQQVMARQAAAPQSHPDD